MQIIPVRNRLAYPAGVAPGFDPGHVASRNISSGHGFSAIASGANFVSLLNGARGTATGTTASKDGTIGNIAAITANQGIAFSGQSSVNDTDATLAAITVWPTGSSLGTPISTGVGRTSGMSILHNGAIFRAYYGAGTYSSTIIWAANIPYFYAVSFNGSVANFVVQNLLTGQTYTQVVSAVVAAVAPAGTYTIGTSGVGTGTTSPAAVMFTPTYLPLAQLAAWADDPWSFWYPQSFAMGAQSATPAAPFVPTYPSIIRSTAL